MVVHGKVIKLLITILMVGLSSAAYSKDYQAGKNFTVIHSTVKQPPPLVEFFSFYCGPCYAFAERINVDTAIRKRLPDDMKLEKYHVSQMGPLGPALTEAWAVAQYAGVDGKVEKLLFEGLQVKRDIKTAADIVMVFNQLGITSEKYAEMQSNFMVKALIARQDNLVEKMKVHGTPSLYVSGKYHINNASLAQDDYDTYAEDMANLVLFLLNKPCNTK
ncbi:DsbA family protein [Klebsiella pneumoniae]|uniref:DsbA family protein n=1 Tax=Klebsiella pneumoniae TaxID=573 RepID=UPI0021473FC0|nr:DsbA family protein [Klebsiella pneumoniae]MCM0850192.1 DsbA family protein [Klebsiella pneumoniae]MCM0996288.1 DsbA family protein [Klebsiella pneumoniae]MCR1010495.1 DsbA family protein [Klebsiella pneumoniae]